MVTYREYTVSDEIRGLGVVRAGCGNTENTVSDEIRGLGVVTYRAYITSQ